ncbi:hypothetical protein POM88_037296 [Heracleum sosnowskyi]|uniref:RNase H type-1 domain-containing protein n=1 Tax=Heracleum sosnowskyi TaxID=360622 RepID=A0AAD8HRB1_9APIA|nr:hypothetical protein POM88_037296 [Heracleum sosnowskyi]
MSVYKIPTAILHDIKAAMAKFWRGTQRNKKFIGRDGRLCVLQNVWEGFKDLSVFNDAMLGRQAWRLVHGEDTLLGKVMKAKYYPYCSFLDSYMGYSGSYSWKSTLPMRELLKYRHIVEDAKCPWCQIEEETGWHALFDCTQVKDLWTKSECGELVGGERNKKVFEEKITPDEVLLARVNRLVEDQGKHGKQIYSQPAICTSASSKIWQAPPSGMVKINADDSIVDDDLVGLGIVSRNHEGEVLFAATRRVRAWWPVEIVEVKALAMAIKLGRQHGCDDVIFESDCQSLITRLSKGAIYFSDLDSTLDDIIFLSSFYKSVFWSHVKRDGNSVAHHLFKLVPFGMEEVWEHCCPPKISPYVLMDSISLL